ncbi:MAG: DNA topoisomerase I [Candidatus Bilamarchaeaceae archaeon]
MIELVVAEKPKVAQKIAEAIGGTVKRVNVGNVSYYHLTRDNKEIYVAPAVGHIYTLTEKKKSWDYPVFDIEWAPAYKVSKESYYTKQYLQVLENLGKKADHFVSACDYDIEGSTIAYNIFRFATNIKEGRRMKFSALTKNDLAEAYEKMGDFDYNNAYAGETRHILDWYYGINLSRALMKSLRTASTYKTLSIGRVQGPALDILANLEREIKSFVPQPYWVLTVKIKDVKFTHKKERFFDEIAADKALENTKNEGVVSLINKKDSLIYPEPCFDLTSLQVEAHKVFGFAPTTTMEVAQSLYEDSLITYPRTSSQKIPSTINVVSIVQRLGEQNEYQKDTQKIIQNRWFKIRQGTKEDPAHPAIHPTGLSPKNIGTQERKLYDLIVRRFLAAFAPPAKRENITIIVESNGEEYVASGGRTVERGWFDFYPYAKTKEIELPKFEEKENVDIKDKKKTKKETTPPQRYTHASIVAELEKRHLGTKATRATIIDTLFKRQYIKGNKIEVTDFGLTVDAILKKYAPEILDEELTRKIENDMDKIVEGKIDKEEVIKEGKEILIQILDKWKKNEEKIGKELAEAFRETQKKENYIGKCEKCGNELTIIKTKDGKQFIGCKGYPNCKNIYPLPSGALVKSLGKECEWCKKPMIRVIQGKKRYDMCIDPNCKSKEEWEKRKKPKNNSE